MDIIGKKKIYFAISLLVMIPGLISLALNGLNLSIDFTGGSRITVAFPKNVTTDEQSFIRNTLEEKKIKVSSVEPAGKLAIIRTSPMSQKDDNSFVKSLSSKYKDAKQEEFSTIGPTIGKETTL